MERNVHPTLLEQIRDSERPMTINNLRWGWIGFIPVSYAIVDIWQANELLAEIEPGKWRLSKKGDDVLAGRVKNSELVFPNPVRTRTSGFVADETPTEGGPQADTQAEQPTTPGSDLFTPAGTCRLCKQTCNPFGWISHAKSHIGKGDPVEVVERKKKKVAVMLMAATTPEALASGQEVAEA